MSHTPGPWTAINIGRHVEAKDGQYVCHIYEPEIGTLDANARLIAAAPAMLEALESVKMLGLNITGRTSLDDYHLETLTKTCTAAIALTDPDLTT